jgi:hypothetical protein
MRRAHWQVLAIGMALSVSAQANDFGAYKCPQPQGCLLSPQYGGPVVSSMVEYLAMTPNGFNPRFLMVEFDTIAFCDGTVCVSLIFDGGPEMFHIDTTQGSHGVYPDRHYGNYRNNQHLNYVPRNPFGGGDYYEWAADTPTWSFGCVCDVYSEQAIFESPLNGVVYIYDVTESEEPSGTLSGYINQPVSDLTSWGMGTTDLAPDNSGDNSGVLGGGNYTPFLPISVGCVSGARMICPY